VGANDEDIESSRPACRGLVLREDITRSANWRAQAFLDYWLKERKLVGIAGVDTRRMASRIRDQGAPKGCLAFAPDGRYDASDLRSRRGASSPAGPGSAFSTRMWGVSVIRGILPV
jgi:carbamoyl-phosphate synthase small subunit